MLRPPLAGSPPPGPPPGPGGSNLTGLGLSHGPYWTHEAQSIHNKQAYNPCSILSCKQAHIHTSSLLSYNYNKADCHNDVDPQPAQRQHNNCSKIETQKSNSRELHSTSAILPHQTPQKALTSLKAGSEITPTSYERNPTLMPTDYTREMSSHTSTASSKRSKTISKRSVSARGVQRYHSRLRRSCLPPEIEEDKVR
ncbi:hypothetical protein F511_29939 [Dorcoceras hygrometricum]|uniref:Uncharacterized protein n=1 Tax=Dorcoceras hygrometricum TaxID=472368 RepID=A0A2Z7BZ08_9LAMI|nr:hypothetical protein F511_29939 [Dorcoceras hygrometricum]